jgi:hypothetical protein
LLLRETAIPFVLRDIKYIDFRNEEEFDARFLELYNVLHDVSERPARDMDTVEAVRRKIRLSKYQEAADTIAPLEEAAARLAGRSRRVAPGSDQEYPEAECRAMFQDEFAKLQRIARDRVSFSTACMAELKRTVAMINTMNLKFDGELFRPEDRDRFRREHREYLEKNLVDMLSERNKAFCSCMDDEFATGESS